jgi:superfamily II DNA helicase RecQ
MSGLNEIGILHYDIPGRLNCFWYRLQRVLRSGRALQASKSVYLVNWADVPKVQELIDKAKEAFAEKYPDRVGGLWGLRMSFLKFDDATAEEARVMAVDGLSRLISEIGAALKARIEKMKEYDEEDLPQRVKRSFAQRVLECEGLAVAFRLMEDVQVALDMVKQIVVTEVGAELYATVADGKRLKPRRKAKKEGTAEPADPQETHTVCGATA